MSEDILKRGIMRELPVPLTKAEHGEKLQELATGYAQLKLIRLQKSDAVKRFKRQLDECFERIEQCALEVDTRSRVIPVECYERCVDGKAEVVRCDTGEVVDRRPLKPDEQQRTMIDKFIDEVAAHEKTWAEGDEKPKRKRRAKAAK